MYFLKKRPLYAYLRTFPTCTLILFGKFVTLYGYKRLYVYQRHQSRPTIWQIVDTLIIYSLKYSQYKKDTTRLKNFCFEIATFSPFLSRRIQVTEKTAISKLRIFQLSLFVFIYLIKTKQKMFVSKVNLVFSKLLDARAKTI